MVISDFFFLPLNLATLVHFFFTKILCMSHIGFVFVIYWENSPQKKKVGQEPNQIYIKLIIARKLKLVGNHSLEIFFQYFSIIVNGRKLCEY
jgi:hypothetical protein